MEKHKNILVTGGAGFIGSHLVNKLIALGHSVTIFDNFSTGLPEYVDKKTSFIKGDIKNEKELAPVFLKKFDVVCHIAGCASSISSFTNPKNDIETNFLGTVNIVNYCLRHKIQRLLYASSMTTYGKVEKLPVDETTPTKPISYYGISKYASERYVHATSERVDLDFPFHVTSFRMFNVYGPRQSLTNPYQGVMAIFIGNVLRKEPIVIFGDGKQSRDFIYIDDVVDIWTKSIDNKKTFNKWFNVAVGKDISVNNLTNEIISILGHNPKTYKIIYKKERPGDQRHMRADISAIKQALNWKPKYSLSQGLKQTLQWAKDQLKK